VVTVRLPDPRMTVVRDPDDVPERTQLLITLANLEAGRVVVRVTPGSPGLHWLALDVLRGLGKDPGRAGSARNAWENWRRATAWLVGERTRDLIVDRAELLSPLRWEQLAALAASCDLSLWLIFHGRTLTRGQRETLRTWPLREIDFPEFIAAVKRDGDSANQLSPVPSGASGATNAFPELPLSDFTTFRADCRRLLSPEEFSIVDREILDGATRTRRLLADRPTDLRAALRDHLRDLIDGCRFTSAAVARLRGAQAACLIAGVLVRVDRQRLCVTSATSNRTAIDATFVRELRRYASTHHAAVALVCALSGLSPQALARLNLADAAPEHVAVGPEERFSMPEAAQAILAAHLHMRLIEGGIASDPLLPSLDDRTRSLRATPRALRKRLADIEDETGLTLWGEWHTLESRSDSSWLARRGITVQVIG
jgi:hypothetical protein